MSEPFTGTDVYRAAMNWQRLTVAQRETWGIRANQRASRGKKTSAQAEFMADYLNKTLKRLKREALRP